MWEAGSAVGKAGSQIGESPECQGEGASASSTDGFELCAEEAFVVHRFWNQVGGRLEDGKEGEPRCEGAIGPWGGRGRGDRFFPLFSPAVKHSFCFQLWSTHFNTKQDCATYM